MIINPNKLMEYLSREERIDGNFFPSTGSIFKLNPISEAIAVHYF